MPQISVSDRLFLILPTNKRSYFRMPIKIKNLVLRLSKGVKYTLFVTNLIAIILLLMATQAPSVSPSQMSIFAYLGIGFIFLLAVNIIYLIIWIISFRWKFIIIQLFALFLCMDAIKTYIPMNKPTPVVDIPENAIKMLSYNVRGFDWKVGDEARKNPILEYIANSDADIICLQEFAVEEVRDKKKGISLKEFDNIMKEYPYRSVTRLGDSKGIIYGLACYSKHRITKVARVPIESQFNGSAMYEIRVGRKLITVINNHLESNHITEEDKALYKELIVEGNKDKFNEVARSVASRLGFAFKTREKQVDIIAEAIEIQRENTKSMVLCGDFNDTPISYAYGKFKGDFEDSYKNTGRGIGITYHENGFLFRIDYIMHTSDIKAYNSTVDKVKYSDHYPLYTFLEL